MRQAYCYLLIPTPDLKKAPKAKLDSLVKYSDLGSGYFIAQEDLEIRGAGDFLGVKQSGHIEAIGLSMTARSRVIKARVLLARAPRHTVRALRSALALTVGGLCPIERQYTAQIRRQFTGDKVHWRGG